MAGETAHAGVSQTTLRFPTNSDGGRLVAAEVGVGARVAATALASRRTTIFNSCEQLCINWVVLWQFFVSLVVPWFGRGVPPVTRGRVPRTILRCSVYVASSDAFLRSQNPAMHVVLLHAAVAVLCWLCSLPSAWSHPTLFTL